MRKDTTHFEVEEALLKEGCPACHLATRSVARYLETLFYEGVNDPAPRTRLQRSMGFCPAHTALILQYGNPLGIALLYRDLISQAQESLGKGRITRRKRSLTPCPACEVEHESERRYLKALTDLLSQPDVQEQFRQSEGLCLPHLEMAFQMASPATLHFLIQSEKEHLNRLQGLLEEIIRKHDYRFQHEPWGSERKAWRQAPRKLSGQKHCEK